MKVNNNVKLNLMSGTNIKDLNGIIMPLIDELPLDLTFFGRLENLENETQVDIHIRYRDKNLTEVYFMPDSDSSVVYSGFNNLGDEYDVSFEKNSVIVSREDDKLGKLEACLYSDHRALR
ncbi:hypothetical protein HN865_02895 [Candidatus Woesearchaeota archaeon]|jgi:hypothetical protein|nr:hypothetical protein [Candidatus Woesearchaeota archaeon]MBT7237782.1 hypothetical protein [Candidatus Woesearchaeota archaeon]